MTAAPAVPLALALLSGSGTRKVEVDLRPLSNVSMIRVGQCSIDVAFRLVVDGGGQEEYYCPAVEWQWEDGTRSVEETDCPPFAEASADDHRRTWMRTIAVTAPGRHEVRVRLSKGDRTLRHLTGAAKVVGAGMSEQSRKAVGCK